MDEKKVYFESNEYLDIFNNSFRIEDLNYNDTNQMKLINSLENGAVLINAKSPCCSIVYDHIDYELINEFAFFVYNIIVVDKLENGVKETILNEVEKDRKRRYDELMLEPLPF